MEALTPVTACPNAVCVALLCRPPVMVVAGRYGLASKEFTPPMAVAVFNHLAAPKPKRHFTVRALPATCISHSKHAPPAIMSGVCSDSV